MIESSYHEGDSFVHSFDPRAKLLLLITGITTLFLPFGVEFSAAYTGVFILLAIPAAGFRHAFSPFKLLLPLIILIILLTPPFFREGEVLITYRNWILLTESGLMRTIVLIIRFTGITYAFFLFFTSTPLNQVVLTLRWYGLPLNAALIVSMSFRFIPYITTTYHHVSDAHKLRGSYQTGMWGWSHIRGLLPVLTSVLIKSVKTIPVMAMSLESRGFGSNRKRTSYQRLRGGRILFTHFIFSVMISLIMIALPYVVA
jgi:energy-coupling factor transport system permease protein